MGNKRKGSDLKKKQQRAGYVFVAPVIVGLAFIFLPIILQTFTFSLFRPVVTKDGYDYLYIGLSEYIKLFTQDTWYLQNLVLSIRMVAVDFASILIFSFFVAVILNKKFRGRGFARVLFFLPVVISAGIISKLEIGDLLTSSMNQMSGADTGVINAMASMDLIAMIRKLSVNGILTEFIIGAVSGIYNIVVSSGVQILVFIAGLQSIPVHLYEAAHVEGCSAWESFWKITLPMISPLILVSGLYTVIDSCSKPANVIMTQVLHQTTMGNYSYSSTMALVYFTLVSLMMGMVFLFVRKLIFYQE
ncbi:MAG: carbohydrate ABC transporter permease [Saccharofermentanales bacterium]